MAAVMATAGGIGLGGDSFSRTSRVMCAVPPPAFVRIVSFNVLSSSLCEPDHYIACKPGDLDPPVRLARLKEQLEPHMSVGAVICLQEVSTLWVGELVPFFESRGYTIVTGNYGNKFNGYMGVSLAWPTARFTSEKVGVTRCADTKLWPKAEKVPAPLKPSKFMAAIGGAWASIRTLWAQPKEKPPFDVWHETERRHNILVSANLRCKKSGKRLSVTTYHMPCLFGSDAKVQVMTNHVSMAAQGALQFAEGTPCVLAGDFNIKPADAPYELLTTGSLPADHPHMPPLPPPNGDTWTPTMPKVLDSAYVIGTGSEPEFTNLATNKWGGTAFCETLDYIFLSSGDGWKVRAVRPLPSKEEVMIKGGCISYPIATEPSDHTMIWADLDLD